MYNKMCLIQGGNYVYLELECYVYTVDIWISLKFFHVHKERIHCLVQEIISPTRCSPLMLAIILMILLM